MTDEDRSDLRRRAKRSAVRLQVRPLPEVVDPVAAYNISTPAQTSTGSSDIDGCQAIGVEFS
jgi:hypothetical protein